MKARPRATAASIKRKGLRQSEEYVKENRQNGHCSVESSQEEYEWTSCDHIPIPIFSLRTASLIIAIVSIVCYWNTCNGDFVFDDSEAIINNKDLRPESSLFSLFVHDFWGGTLTANESHKSYRPLTVFTFRLNYWLSGGLNPWGFHIVNVVLHGIVSILSLLVFDEVFENSSTTTNTVSREGLLCAVIFAVHPIHTESVAGIVGRADLLCALCFFVSFLVFIRCCKLYYSNSQSALGCLLISSFLCGLAMLFKEQGITVLGLCCAYDVIVVCKADFVQLLKRIISTKKNGPSNVSFKMISGLLYRQAALVLVGFMLLLVRWNVMGSTAPHFQVSDNPASFEKFFLTRVINYNYIYAINLWILACPYWLCFDWSMGCIPLIKSLSDVRILGVLLMWAVVAGLLSYCLFGPPSRYRRVCTMGLAFLVVPFLPASNVFFRVGFVVAERVLYLSSVGSCILVVLGVKALSAKLFLRKRNSHWLNEDALFTSGESVCPLNAKVHYNIGKVRSNQHKDDEALRYYRQAVRLNPTYHDALNNLGNLLKEKGEIKEAEELLERAVQSSHTFAAGWMNLGTVKAAMNKMEESELCYKNAIRFRKKFPDAYFNLGNLYIDWGRRNDAVAAFKKAVHLKKTHVGAWLNHILLLDKSDRRQEGIMLAREALNHIPNEASIHFNLGNMLGQESKYEEAEKHFLRAIKINPLVAEVQGNLGVLYHRWGKLDEAERQYEIASGLDPQGTNIKENIDKLKRAKRKLTMHR